MAKEVFVVEFPLKVEKWQADLLNRRYEYLRNLYNYAQWQLLRHYRYLSQMDAYRQCRTKKQKGDFLKDYSFHVDGIHDRKGKPFNITFTQYGINGFVTKLARRNIGGGCTYADVGINSMILNHMSDAIWRSWEKMIYNSKTRRIHFKKRGDFDSFGAIVSSDGRFVGFNLHLYTMDLDVNLNDNRKKDARHITLPIQYNLKHAGYEMSALQGSTDSIRMICIIHRLVRGLDKYYLQLTIEGEKPQKGRQLGKGTVGIDIGPTTIAVVGDNITCIDKLAAKCDDYQKEILHLQRKIDRSRRATNPQNYNPDGTIRRGVRLVWNKSARYKELARELAELMRRQAAVRKTIHIERANNLLKEGNVFIVENNPVSSWTAKSKKTVVSEKTGRILKKKRWGKSVANHAPAMFVTILKNKVESLGGIFIKADPKNAASQYDFTDGSFTRHELKERSVTLSNGDIHQRDLLAAFNLKHLQYDKEEMKQYDQEAMRQNYRRFCLLEAEELERYRCGEKKDDRSTIAASIVGDICGLQ